MSLRFVTDSAVIETARLTFFDELATATSDTARGDAAERYVASVLENGRVLPTKRAPGHDIIGGDAKIEVKCKHLKGWEQLKQRYVDLSGANLKHADYLVVVFVVLSRRELFVRTHLIADLRPFLKARTRHRLLFNEDVLDLSSAGWPDPCSRDPR